MVCRLATTYSMLGRNGHQAPSPPQPQPSEDEDPCLADADGQATAGEEDDDDEQPADPEQAAILESCRWAHDQRITAHNLEEANELLLQMRHGDLP
jgi:hypothetical protein